MHSSPLHESWWKYLARTAPRIVSQLDRDRHSPTFGSFDRDYWHYKIRDYSSIILQQGMIVLHVLKSHAAGHNVFYHRPEPAAWVAGCLEFWAKSQLNSGSFNEYYPHEHGFPPTAFSLYAVGLMIQSNEYAIDHSTGCAVQRAVDWLTSHQEKKALNQEMAALAGMALCARLPGIKLDPVIFERRLDDFFKSQSAEGWFPEYDGPDLGYLSVTIDCLYDYYLVSRDDRALQAMTKAVDFIFSLITVSDELPVMINSRNTGYVVPYGLVRLAESNGKAASIIVRLFSGIDTPRHFLNKIDDRYTCHYIFQSCFRALPHLDRVDLRAAAPRAPLKRYSESSGIFVEHTAGASIVINARKGGVLYCFGKDGLIASDYGWRAKLGDSCAVSHWLDLDYQCSYARDTITIAGRLSKHGWLVPSVLKSAGLRLLSRLLGNKLIPLLKNIMIFNKKPSGIAFVRTVQLHEQSIVIQDEFTGRAELLDKLEPAPHYSLRHVASAGSFEFEELPRATSPAVRERIGNGVSRRLIQIP